MVVILDLKKKKGVAFVNCEGFGEVVNWFEEFIYCGEEDLGVSGARLYEIRVVVGAGTVEGSLKALHISPYLSTSTCGFTMHGFGMAQAMAGEPQSPLKYLCGHQR